VGEALRPIVRKSIVNASYGVAASYCIADVAWESYKVCILLDDMLVIVELFAWHCMQYISMIYLNIHLYAYYLIILITHHFTY
jgi:hypothetical protein